MSKSLPRTERENPGNAKLSRRVRFILSEATGASVEKVEEALENAGGDVPVALISLVSGVSAEEAGAKLRESRGSIRRAIELARQSFTSVPGLAFARPEEVGLDPVALERAFDVVKQAVGNGEGEIPGAVCAVVHGGKVIGPRAFGLAVRAPVTVPAAPSTVFDLASLTKVVATLPSILVLLEMGKLRLDDRVASFLPDFGANGKESITIRHLLTHTSGLPAHVKFYEMGLDRAGIIRKICETGASAPGEHVVYSDLGFIILGEIVERISGKPLDEFARENIWRPLGMNDTRFLPGESSRHRIAATEYRADLGKFMWGEVHDENAYAMGGVAGHAGLFSTITDLARYALMWLGEGKFGPVRVLSRSTVRLAIEEHVNKEDRRGLGWALKSRSFSSAGDLLSDAAYGHTGFTGTSLWCDPKTQTAIILLTNRVHAGRDGTAIVELRPRFANAVAAAIDRGDRPVSSQGRCLP